MSPDDPLSKTSRKREMHVLQALGETLIGLSEERLRALPLPEQLLAAVLDARKMTKRGALRRQRQYIGKIMRSIDAEPIRSALRAVEEVDRRHALVFKRAERWRDHLIEEGDAAVVELSESVESLDTQRLRALLRDARSELEIGAKRGGSRSLFRYLHDLFAGGASDRSEG